MSTQLDAGDSDEHELGASVTENWIWDHVWLDAIIGVVAGHHEKVSRCTHAFLSRARVVAISSGDGK